MDSFDRIFKGMDTLALALALAIAHDSDRAAPMSTPTIRSASWSVERNVAILPPPEGLAILTRPMVKVAEPSEITFKSKGE